MSPEPQGGFFDSFELRGKCCLSVPAINVVTFTLVFLILFSVFFSVILRPISTLLSGVQEWFSEFLSIFYFL